MQRTSGLASWLIELTTTEWKSLPEDAEIVPLDVTLSARFVGFVRHRRLAELLRLLLCHKLLPDTRYASGYEERMWYDGESVELVKKHISPKGSEEFKTHDGVFDWLTLGFEKTWQATDQQPYDHKVDRIMDTLARMPRSYLEYCQKFKRGYPLPGSTVHHDRPVSAISL